MIHDIQPPDPATAARLRAAYHGHPIVDIAEYAVRQFADIEHYLPEMRSILAASLLAYWYNYPELTDVQVIAALARFVPEPDGSPGGEAHPAIPDPASGLITPSMPSGVLAVADCLLCRRPVQLVNKVGPGTVWQDPGSSQ